MKGSRKVLFAVLILLTMFLPVTKAMTVHDPIHTAVSQLQNAILQSEWAKEIALAVERLNELRTQTMELFRFHAGLDEILDSIIGDPMTGLLDFGKEGLWNAFVDAGLITPQIEIFEGRSGPSDIRRALEEITGAIPEGNQRPYIPFEEMAVVDAFDFARMIREAGEETRSSAERIAEQAKEASPKGAARLHAQGISQLMLLSQQNQEAMAKLLELTAVQIEQVTRLEKDSERDRIRYLNDANRFLEDHFADIH